MVCDLANAFGNLLSRCTAEKLNPYQLYPVFKKNVFEKMATRDDKKLLDQLKSLAGEVLLISSDAFKHIFPFS